MRGGGGWALLPSNSDRARGDGLGVRQGRFRLEIGNNFCPGRAVRRWPRLPRAGGESPSLGGFKHGRDVAPQDVVEQAWGVLGGWLDLMVLEAFSNLHDSVVLWFYVSCSESNCLSFIKPHLGAENQRELLRGWQREVCVGDEQRGSWAGSRVATQGSQRGAPDLGAARAVLAVSGAGGCRGSAVPWAKTCGAASVPAGASCGGCRVPLTTRCDVSCAVYGVSSRRAVLEGGGKQVLLVGALPSGVLRCSGLV